MPFQRLYVVHTPDLIQIIQSKANAAIFIPNLLDFGMLFSGMNKESEQTLRKVFNVKGNGFTMSVHKFLLSGPSLSVPINLASGGLVEQVRHELTLCMTGAIYGPENPYDDPQVEASWW
jgi:hypothetical protein